MGVSIEEYRQRIGCFAGVATVLSSCGVRSNSSNTCRKQSKHSRTALTLFIRLSCLVVLLAAVIQSSPFVLDLTQFGDVEKNPGPDYKFHLIGDDNFEKFAVTVLGHIYNIKTLLTFSKGPDGGRDAAAHNVNIDFGGGNLENQDLIVQVKHTGKVESITDSVRKRIFKEEKEKVEKLVKENQLDTTYIMFTNYDLPALQEQKLNKCFNAAKNVPAEKGVELNDSEQIVNCFKGAGAKHVVIIGKETLSQWLGDYPELQMKVIRYYPHGDVTDLMHCSEAVKSIQLLKIYREDLEKTIDVEAYVEALTKAKEIVKSDKGLVFITGVPGSGKTTVAKQLVIQLFDEYDSFTYYDNTFPKDFLTNFFLM